jgi:hypothetical protein
MKKMPTLNVNASDESLKHLDSLYSSGIPKGKIVSIAILNLSKEKLLEISFAQVKTKKPKSDGKKKSS